MTEFGPFGLATGIFIREYRKFVSTEATTTSQSNSIKLNGEEDDIVPNHW